MSSVSVADIINEIYWIMKAPPGPKPKRYGDHIIWDEDRRKWVDPTKGTTDSKPSKKEPAKDVMETSAEEPKPALGRVTGKIDWIKPIEKTNAKGVVQKFTKTGQLVPPGWKGAQINSDPKGNWQAIGVDSAGRTVKLPSEAFTAERSDVKFKRRRDFAATVPQIRKKFRADFNKVEEAKVLAVVDATSFRIGGEGSDNFGITTLQSRHVQVKDDEIEFDFVGKKHQRNYKVIQDARIAKMIAERKKVLGDNDSLFSTSDAKVRGYMKQAGFGRFSPKDFRTHAGTEIAKRVIKTMTPPSNEKELKKMKLSVGKVVSDWLSNTPSVSLGSYIDPVVFKKWEKGIAKAYEDWTVRWNPEFDLEWEDYGYQEGWDGIQVVEEMDL